MRSLFTLVALFAFAIQSHAQTKIQMAITVDDLPTHGKLPPKVSREDVAKKMVAVFKKHKIPEVYAFINAGKVEERHESMEVLQIWKDAGYPFGNHTYLHSDINKVSIDEFKAAIDKNEPMLKALSGSGDWKFFRYPYLREGDTMEKRNAIRKHLFDHGYKIAQVTIDFEDWSWNDPYARCMAKGDLKSIEWLKETYLGYADQAVDMEEFLSKALFKRSIPHILLLHIGAFDSEMLDELLTRYEQKGVEFIPLSQAMRDEVYAQDPGIAQRNGSELTFQVMKARGLKSADIGLPKPDRYPGDKLDKVCL
ncbi:MAG: polysaccharide deacetylase family protein [Bdellovibrionia bacterium]